MKRENAGLLVLAGLFAVFGYVTRCAPGHLDGNATPAPVETRTPEKIAEDEQRAKLAAREQRKPASPPVAKSCVVSIAGESGPVLVFPTEGGYDEFGKAAASRVAGAADVVAKANGGYWVPKGTKCLWIDRGLLTAQVRILEGAHAGRVGWMDREWSEGAD